MWWPNTIQFLTRKKVFEPGIALGEVGVVGRSNFINTSSSSDAPPVPPVEGTGHAWMNRTVFSTPRVVRPHRSWIKVQVHRYVIDSSTSLCMQSSLSIFALKYLGKCKDLFYFTKVSMYLCIYEDSFGAKILRNDCALNMSKKNSDWSFSSRRNLLFRKSDSTI